MLVLYVATIIYVQNMGLKLIIDEKTMNGITYSLDIPTMLVLVIYAGLSFRQELTKPKYNIAKKNQWMIDTILAALGLITMAGLLVIKYLV